MIKNQNGFTLIEILMVVMLVAIMALVAIPQYLDFQTNAKNQATKGALGSFRTAIENAKTLLVVKCGGTPGTLPSEGDVTGNDMTVSGVCTSPGEITAAEKNLISASSWPVANPWTGNSTVTACGDTAACTARTGCSAAGTFDGGWCYDDQTGTFFANSNSNGEKAF